MGHKIDVDTKTNGLRIDGFNINRKIDPLLNKSILDSKSIDDKTVIVGFVVQDENPKHPLKPDNDGFFNSGDGVIYNYDNNNSTEDEKNYLNALGFYKPDNPRQGRAHEIKHSTDSLDRHEIRQLYAEKLNNNHSEFIEQTKMLSDKDFLNSVAYSDDIDPDEDILFDVKRSLWLEGRINGTIGNPYAIGVLSDSSMNYSAFQLEKELLGQEEIPSNSLWIPNEIDIEAIEYHAIQSLLPLGTRAEYTNKEYIPLDSTLNDISYILPNDIKQGGFTNFVDAIEAAGKALNIDLPRDQVIKAGQDVAYDYAQEACAKYTAFVNGNVYSILVETLEKTGPTWNSINIDRCDGYYNLETAHLALDKVLEEPFGENEQSRHLLTNREQVNALMGNTGTDRILAGLATNKPQADIEKETER